MYKDLLPPELRHQWILLIGYLSFPFRFEKAEKLRNISILIRELNPRMLPEDYKKVLIENAGEDDFIYLDPPYSPISATANFTTYTSNGFGQADQIQLADLFKSTTNSIAIRIPMIG